MSRCLASFIGLSALAATALAPAQADVAIDVFTDTTRFRFDTRGATVHDLSAPRKIIDGIELGLSNNPADAQAAAAARFEAARGQLADAYGGHVLAIQYGIAKIPAIVFNHGEAVIYGPVGIGEASALYWRWKGVE